MYEISKIVFLLDKKWVHNYVFEMLLRLTASLLNMLIVLFKKRLATSLPPNLDFLSVRS